MTNNQPEKSVEEIVEYIVDSLEPIWTEADAYETEHGYTPLVSSRELAIKVLTQTLQAERQRCEEFEYTDTTDKNYSNYQTYYGAVNNNPLFKRWREVAQAHGIDVDESIETGWMSDSHFAKFLDWVVSLNSLEPLFIESYPDLREITFHSNGDVIIKTGANAANPKKLYNGKALRNPDGTLKEQPNWTNQIRVAIHKLLQDKDLT